MDELDRVRELLPEQPPPTRRRQAEARARLLQLAGSSGARRRRPARRSAVRLAAAVVAAAAVPALLVAPLYVPDLLDRPDAPQALDPARGVPADSPSSAKAMLLDAARRVEGLAPEPAGTYWKVRTMHAVPYSVGATTTYTVEDRNLEEQWLPAAAGEPSWLGSCDLGVWPKTRADEQAWASDGRPSTWAHGERTLVRKPGACTVDQAPGELGFALGEDRSVAYEELKGLPTDASELRTYLWKRRPSGEVDPTQWLYSAASALLAELPAQPQTRAAALRLLCTLPDVKYVGAVRDSVGRSGLAIALVDRAGNITSTQQLIVDPRTGKLLARTLNAVSSTGSPIKQGSRVVLSAGWTNARPARPDPKLN